MASEKVVQLTDGNFEAEVVSAKTPVLVDFWAEWCMPCRMVAPILDELAGEYDGKIKVAKLNVDEARATAMKFGITSIPTLILFKDGQPVRKVVGAKSKKDLKAELDAVLGS